ncbi:phospholipid-transporting ATPase FetA-like [Orycteropus afer afer]|uniref:Phospholipid-transporting ATPase n=1 Tax=Orycteropus afer afer TaxID=1230840 RepID=A0A8B7AB57_ORYAF|nr:phospholipid-transporting ATPase FetA-like [Orycteropus afer afer]
MEVAEGNGSASTKRRIHRDREQFEEDRRLQANNREFNATFGYPDNTIKTSKYSVFNFLPLNLFEQFQRLANAYFLLLLCLQLIPQISSLAWYSTVVPLVVVLSITAVKDAIDDLKRHESDNQVNNRPVLLLVDGRVEEDKWMNVQVGDIIKLENNHSVTADVLLLSSSEPYSLTYIETTELDGETNLKVKQAISVTSKMEDNLELLSAFDGKVSCEPPNNKLDKFTGILMYKEDKFLLDHDKLLLRGCTIRNTDWCYGLVIYTGPDTKLMQNSGKSTFKRTHIDHLMNVFVIWIFLFLGSMCFVLAIGHGIWERKKGYYFQTFLPWEEYASSSLVSAILIFWSYFIILNTVVPISLYVSVEIIRLGNSYYINWDQKMFYAPRNIPAQARTTTLNEELGQVKYVFSDKTGTLTQNIMIFNKCSINGKFYGAVYDKNGQRVEISEKTEKVDFSYNKLADPKFSFYDKTLVEAVKTSDYWVHLFFLSLSVCHTVMSEERVEETAVNIAYSCNIFDEEMDGVFVVEGKDAETLLKELRSARNRMKPESLLNTDPVNISLTKTKKPFRIPEEEPNGNYGLIINGYSMAYALEGNLELELLRTACMCKAVVWCRMTPLQKAQVVDLVKRYKKVVTLAIGDGANDVGMIKAAHIGVGVRGREGAQAVLSSDFTLPQFHYLQRLLLVHGRWSYNRMCKFLSYFFYKNFAFTLVHFWYAFFNGFSAQTIYDNWFITFYNLVYTALPVLSLSLFDQDVDDMCSLRFPELYEPGQDNLHFNRKEFVKCLLHGVYSSLMLFLVPMKTICNSMRSDGKDISDYQSFSMMVQTSLLCVVTMQIALETTYWTVVSHLFTWGSLGFSFCTIFFLYSDGLCQMFPNVFGFLGVARNTLNQPQAWLSVTLSVALCMLPVIGYKFIKPLVWPVGMDKALFRIRQCMKHPLPPPARAKVKAMGSRRSAYAFSHKQGFGALITSGKTVKSKSA